jgi:glycosyltransferase involved in cell wall biosynthesis
MATAEVLDASSVPAARRLLHVTTVPDSLIFLDGQIQFMKSRGFDVSVVSSPGPFLFEFGKQAGVEVYPIEMPRLLTPVSDARSLSELYRVVRKVRPHIVHGHTPKGGLLAMLAALAAGTPVRIYHMRGLLLITATGFRRPLFATTERVACAVAHHVLCNSHSLRSTALKERLCNPKKLEVLLSGSGNGVDSKGRFNPDAVGSGERSSVRESIGVPQDALVVGFVGRLVGDKGVGELCAAWRRVREEVPACRLVVVGPFEPRDPISPADKQLLETDERVHLLGFRRDLPELYRAMDVLALPTYREGFPNVLLEAQSMRVPVVSTRVEGCLDAVEDGVTGQLVPARDATALERAILTYLRDPALRARHGAAGRQRILELFERERLWQALFERYESLLAERASELTAVS